MVDTNTSGYEKIGKMLVRYLMYTQVNQDGSITLSANMYKRVMREIGYMAQPKPTEQSEPHSIVKVPTLVDMVDGETKFTVSWAMYRDSQNLLWLYGGYPVTDEVRGTSKMKVTKEYGNYIVDVSNCKDIPFRTIPFGRSLEVGDKTVSIPVAKLIGVNPN